MTDQLEIRVQDRKTALTELIDAKAVSVTAGGFLLFSAVEPPAKW
jgi:hypothetical protein